MFCFSTDDIVWTHILSHLVHEPTVYFYNINNHLHFPCVPVKENGRLEIWKVIFKLIEMAADLT